ncbi:MAG: pentapeptide repeat-containing protein [Planctomycetota bacterium]|nr:pentapeptide repeat-containing protein [Planctomycetota bacterium]
MFSRPQRQVAQRPAAAGQPTAALPGVAPSAPATAPSGAAALLRFTPAHEGVPRTNPTNLAGAQLAGKNLEGLDLSKCDLSDADLSGARAAGVNLRGTKLTGADLSRIDLTGADLLGANLAGAMMDHAQLRGANLTRSNLREADLSRSDLRDAKLFGAKVAGTVFERADMRGSFLGGMTGYEHAEWKNVDIRDIDQHGTYLARRFITDQNYIHEFRRRGLGAELVYRIWWLTSDCGRSGLRWGLLTAFLMVIFAKAYTFVGIDYGANETWLSPLYYSVVTLTTLGYGDALPTSVGAQALSMLEVSIGYVMLGGLLSIFSTKMARRSE